MASLFFHRDACVVHNPAATALRSTATATRAAGATAIFSTTSRSAALPPPMESASGLRAPGPALPAPRKTLPALPALSAVAL